MKLGGIRTVLSVLLVLALFSVGALADFEYSYSIRYINTYNGGPNACDGDLSLSVVLNNQGDNDQEALVMIANDPLHIQATSPIVTVAEDRTAHIPFTLPVQAEEITGGEYELTITITTEEGIQQAFKTLTLEQCPENAAQSSIVNTYKASELNQREPTPVQEAPPSLSIWMILPLTLLVILIILITLYIFIERT